MTQHIKYSENLIFNNEKSNQFESDFLDSFKINILDEYYKKDDSIFRKKIDFLNMRFYIETEKCLNSKKDGELCKDQLLVILFKQITLYLEEIGRLNILLKEKEETHSSTKEKIEFQNKLKEQKRELKLWECKFNTLNDSYLKIKTECERLKIQNEIYEKIKPQTEEKADKKRENSNNKNENPNKISLMPLSSAYETNIPTDSTKDTNETNIENQNALSFSNFLQKNRYDSDQNSGEPKNNNSKGKLINNDPIEVNNININLNLHWKNNNQTNITLNNPQNTEGDNKKRDISKAYNTLGNTKTGQQILNKSPKRSFLEKQEVNTKIKPKINKIQNASKDKKGNMNSNVKIVTNNINKNNEITIKKIKKQSFVKDDNKSMKPPILISHNNEESKLNISLTDITSADISAIKNIVSSYFNKYEDELNELNQLENLILRMTEETETSGRFREFRILKQDVTKNYSYSDGENKHPQKYIFRNYSLNNDIKFKNKKSHSSWSTLLENNNLYKKHLPSVTIDLTNKYYDKPKNLK